MTRNDVIKYIRKTFKVEPSYPFEDDIVVFKTNKKWFGIIMNVSRCIVYRKENDVTPIDILNVKLDPMFVSGIKNTKGFAPAYHMNKKHWVSIVLKEVDSSKIKDLIKLSYGLVNKKKSNDRNHINLSKTE